MCLQSQRLASHTAEGGFAMAALLVGLAGICVVMSMALPVWSHATKREREAELIFRGEQYARAIELYQRKAPGAFPIEIDTLIEQRFLRRKYKDPMTGDGEFQLIYQAQASQGQGAPATANGMTQPAGPLDETFGGNVQESTPPRTPGDFRNGITGVVSKSTDTSIRLYNGHGTYNEWTFIYLPTTTRPDTGRTGQRLTSGQPGRGDMEQPGEGH